MDYGDFAGISLCPNGGGIAEHKLQDLASCENCWFRKQLPIGSWLAVG